MLIADVMEEMNSSMYNCCEIVIFGFGRMCESYIKEIQKDFLIKYIIDNDEAKIGSKVFGAEIISFAEYLSRKDEYKVLVSTHYHEISKQLIENGKRENIDFYDLYKFIPIWYWYNKKKVYMFKTEIMITTRCSLNCEKCGMFIPYYENHKDRDFFSIKDDIDTFFSLIDKVYIFNILGGEPFLHKDLNNIICYIGRKYSSKIGKLVITTNGTIIPEKDLLESIKKYKIEISISDYSSNISYKNNLDDLEKYFKNENINYVRNKDIWWYDLAFPNKPLSLTKNEAISNMKTCSLVCRGISEKKLYYCHLAWSAAKSGLVNENENDFINLAELKLNNNDRKKIVEYECGYLKEGHLSLCAKCAGMSNSNTKVIKSGIQIRKKGKA